MTNNIVSKELKTMDMRIYWLRYRVLQGQFLHYCQASPTNLGNCVTKHHAAIHHCTVWQSFLTPLQRLDLLRKEHYKQLVNSKVRIPP